MPDKEAILYELLCCGEWRDEREEQMSTPLPRTAAGSYLSYLNPSKLIRGRRKLSLTESVRWLKGIGPVWKIALAPNGSVIAILQNSCLETRSSKDNFVSTMGRNVVSKDPNASFRMMTWSLDSLMLAVAFSNGQITFYDTMAVELFSVRHCTLPSQEGSSNLTFSMDNVLAGLFFSNQRVKKNKYPSELITVDTKGVVKCFRQTSADQMSFHHEASLKKYYPKGVFSATCDNEHGIILVSGALELEPGQSPEEGSAHRFGITAWRLLNDSPYYKILFNVESDEYSPSSRRSWGLPLLSVFQGDKWNDAVFKLLVAPNDKYVAALHTSGSVSFWHLPSLKMFRSWHLKTQFHYSAESPQFNNRWRVAFNRWNEEQIDQWRFHPQDVSWWDENVVIISRVNGCLSLCSVNEEYPCKNLLGDSPETFEGPTLVTSKKDQGFLALECQYRLKMEERRNTNGEVVKLSEPACLELLDAYDTQFLPKTIIQEVLFWMTDAERFRPPRKRKRKPPVWNETHQLYLIRNITPQELFHQKIEMEEYGEALDLARTYKLDSDLVYQRQWTKSRVTLSSIKDYLGKIKKRNWVLQECLERVPPNAEAARELLNFGLKGTDIAAAVQISQGRDKGMFQLLTADDLEMSKEDYLLLIDSSNLEVQRLLSYRKKYIYFLDVLETYELMVGGPQLVHENFDGATYAKLRNRTPLESAIEIAKESDVGALRILLRHHWSDIASEYLTVLSSFPETTSPHDYSDFLPEIVRNGEALLWEDSVTKDKDWCERFLPSEEQKSGSIKAISAEQVSLWYEERIHEIEKLSGITNHALDLAKLGIQRNIPELASLIKDLEVVEIMVYDANVDVTLEQLEDLSPIDRLTILMSNTTDRTFISHIREYVLPFLQKCETQEPGSRFHIFDQYLTSISTSDLSKALQVFQHSRPASSDPIISDICELMQIAYNCIYACKNPKQIDNILDILTCLPERHHGIIPEHLKNLHDRVDDLELHYQGVKILDKYNVGISLQELKDKAAEADADDPEVESFFKKICDSPRLMKTPLKLNDWKTLLYDILDLQKKVFKNYPVERCFELYVEALLRSGSSEVINLARDFIDRQIQEEKQDENEEVSHTLKKIIRRVSSAYSNTFALYLYLLPYSRGLEMVLISAHHYFDSASNYLDSDIELCKVCLSLMQNPKEGEIAKIFDLIDAMKIINKDFQLNILPQQVRLSRDRSKILQQCMENIPDGYKKLQQLLKLAVFLRLGEDNFAETESWIYDMCGNAALLEQDMKYCVKVCESIMAKHYETGWRIFMEAAKYQSDPPLLDNATRLIFINYALNMCPDDQIMNVLNSKYLIEIRSLQARISELSPENSHLDPELLDQPETDNNVPDTLDQEKLKEFLNTTTRWINPLKDVANVVTGTLMNPSKLAGITSRIMSDVKHRESISLPSNQHDENEPNDTFSLESYPFFYLGEEELKTGYFHKSLLAFKYDSFSKSSDTSYLGSKPALELCITLNRIWHYERNLLGTEECGKREDSVLEQLLVDILPEDLIWGIAILFSIEEIETLRSVLSKVPVSLVSCNVILYVCSLLIAKHMDRLENTLRQDPNLVVAQTKMFVENSSSSDEEESELTKLFDLFRSYQKTLNQCITGEGDWGDWDSD